MDLNDVDPKQGLWPKTTLTLRCEGYLDCLFLAFDKAKFCVADIVFFTFHSQVQMHSSVKWRAVAFGLAYTDLLLSGSKFDDKFF